MTVIVDLSLPAESFELGRILSMEHGTAIELETLVPFGERAVPFFTVADGPRTEFEEAVRAHPSVERIREVSEHDGETLYALDWAIEQDRFFGALREHGAHILSATGGPSDWEFRLRFDTHEALSAFQGSSMAADLDLDVGRIYNPTQPGAGMWYGLTPAQRETLPRAVAGGYYSIPREMSSQDLADELGISDQAVTERLRRGIATLVENTLLAATDVAEEPPAEE